VNERKPQMIEIRSIFGTKAEARQVESLEIEQAAIGNRWLLNANKWRHDKMARGVPKPIVNAYQLQLQIGMHRLRDGDVNGFYWDTMAQYLEQAFPCLRIYRHRVFVGNFVSSISE
jgi:hypothetical protein